MKIKTRLVFAAALAGLMASASAGVDKQAVKDAFAKAPGAEVPYIASKLVLKAKKADKVKLQWRYCARQLPEAGYVCCSRQFHFQLGAEAAPELAAEAVKLAPQY